jgi:acyl carrier protein
MRKLINYTKTEIKQIISNNLDIDIKNVKDNSYLSDLGIDSIDAVELILQLEKKYKISIPDELAEKVKKVEDIFTCLEKCK